MLSISSSIAGTVACALLVAVVPLATTVQGQLNIISMIPENILSVIPDACQGNADAEFETAVNCGVANIGVCMGLMGLIPEFGNLPTTASEIETCENINAPFCRFANACAPCSADFEALVTCVVLKTEGIDQEKTDFINGCSLGCGGDVAVAADTDADADTNLDSDSDGYVGYVGADDNFVPDMSVMDGNSTSSNDEDMMGGNSTSSNDEDMMEGNSTSINEGIVENMVDPMP